MTKYWTLRNGKAAIQFASESLMNSFVIPQSWKSKTTHFDICPRLPYASLVSSETDDKIVSIHNKGFDFSRAL